jgi:hypothetical protein
MEYAATAYNPFARVAADVLDAANLATVRTGSAEKADFSAARESRE